MDMVPLHFHSTVSTRMATSLAPCREWLWREGAQAREAQRRLNPRERSVGLFIALSLVDPTVLTVACAYLCTSKPNADVAVKAGSERYTPVRRPVKGMVTSNTPGPG